MTVLMVGKNEPSFLGKGVQQKAYGPTLRVTKTRTLRKHLLLSNIPSNTGHHRMVIGV